MFKPCTYIGVVFGGASGAHDISIKSASTVIKALNIGRNKNKFKTNPIYIDPKGRWWGRDVANTALRKGKALQDKE